MLKNILKISLPSLLIIFLLLELGLRVQHFFVYSTGKDTRSLVRDSEIGWAPKENHTFKNTVSDLAGTENLIEYQTFKDGFRLYGKTKTRKKKVLVVGDSFTHASNVSNNETYYHHLKKQIGDQYEVFAIGAGGYSPLQEWLTIKRYWDEIDPDIIIWQLCPNDLIDSLWQLDKIQYLGGISFNRPYLELAGKTVWTGQYSSWFSLFDTLSFLQVIHFIGQKFLQAKSLNESINGSLVDRLREKGKLLEGYNKAVELLKVVFSKLIVADRPGVKVYTFSNDPKHPFGSSLEKLSRNLGFHFLEGVSMTLAGIPKSERKRYFAADDYHWNKNGHQLVGEMMAYELQLAAKNGN
jgi:hypothetical protein